MKRLLKVAIWLVLVIGLLSVCTAGYFWYLWSSSLPYIGLVNDYKPPVIAEVLSDDGEVIGRLWEEKRIVIPLADMPRHLIYAFIAAEDARFFEHEGVDMKGIMRALIRNFVAGKIKQGGSTITQQVTRSLLLKNAKRTYRRKVREVILSVQLEKSFSKDYILFLYLNQIYLGSGAYGVEAASRTYFHKSAKDLSIAEAALLAGLPQAPALYSPVKHFDRAMARQRYVLSRMREEGFISEEQFRKAMKAELNILKPAENTFKKAPYFTEHVRRYLISKYGKDLIYRGGFKVYTTVDLDMQNAARNALRKGLSELDKREGYRGPLAHLSAEEIPRYIEQAVKDFSLNPLQAGSVVEGLVEDVDDGKGEVEIRMGKSMGRLSLSAMKWARRPDPEVPYYSARLRKPSDILSKGDVIKVKVLKEGASPFVWEVSLEQTPVVQGAIFCMVPETGEVKAMIGGRDFWVSQFNRAIQSRRQPGSAFKPIIYAAALDRGMSPVSIIMDSPYIAENNTEGQTWKPKNYREKFFGPTLFRTGLIESRNVITVKILKKIGVRYVIEYARNMGIESDLSLDLSLALGSSGVSLMEITGVYSVFANGGKLVKPVFIRRIVDRNGEIVEENQSRISEVISKETSYVMTDLLKAVIQEGTGWRIRALGRPAAGKTGTTNNLWDAWFIGYTPQLVTGVWVGYDDRRVMGKGETGSRAASPIWLYFMSDVLKDQPVVDFEVPRGVIFAKIDAETGLLAGPYSKKTVLQAFKEGSEPTEYSPGPESAKQGQFMEFDMDYAK